MVYVENAGTPMLFLNGYKPTGINSASFTSLYELTGISIQLTSWTNAVGYILTAANPSWELSCK